MSLDNPAFTVMIRDQKVPVEIDEDGVITAPEDLTLPDGVHHIFLGNADVGVVTATEGKLGEIRPLEIFCIGMAADSNPTLRQTFGRILDLLTKILDQLEGDPRHLDEKMKIDHLETLEEEWNRDSGKILLEIIGMGSEAIEPAGYANIEEINAHLTRRQAIMDRYAVYLETHPEDRPAPKVEE